MKSKMITVAALALASSRAMAWDAAEAPRYGSPNMYRPSVADMTVKNVLGNFSGDISSLFTDAGRSAMFGVKCDGASGTDNTAAINAMLRAVSDAHLPPGVCRVTDQIVVPAGHMLRGYGNTTTLLAVSPDFKSTAASVATMVGEGSRLQDLGIDFYQPDTTLRSALKSYPWAIQQTGSGGGWTIDRVRISRATKGLDMRGDQGASKIGLLEMSFFEMGMQIDGNRDTLNVQNLRFGSYGFTSNNYQILFDNNMSINGGLGLVGLNSGRMDGLVVDSFFSIFAPKALRFYYSPGWNGDTLYAGITTAVINKLQLDTTGGLLCEWCNLSISAFYNNIGYPGYTALIMHGGSINIGQLAYAQFIANLGGTPPTPPATEVPAFQIDNLNAASKFTVAGMTADQINVDRSLFSVKNVNSYFGLPQFQLAAVSIAKDPTKAYTKPVFDLPGATGSIMGVSLNDLTTGSGTIFGAPNDYNMSVVMPIPANWAVGVPSYYKNFTVNFGVSSGSLSLPSGAIFGGGNITSAATLVGAAGVAVGSISAPVRVIDANQNASVQKFGANGATPVGKCTLAAALPADGTATNAALAAAYNSLRTCNLTNGLAQ